MELKSYRPISKELNPGDVVSINYFYKVIEHQTFPRSILLVEPIDEPGQRIEVSDSIVESNFYSADFYKEEVEICLTEVESIFLSAGESVFSVSFKKQDGSSRVLKGYLTGKISLGRALVIDAEVNEPRQVDLRELDWVILRGVKYSVKSRSKKSKKAAKP